MIGPPYLCSVTVMSFGTGRFRHRTTKKIHARSLISKSYARNGHGSSVRSGNRRFPDPFFVENTIWTAFSPGPGEDPPGSASDSCGCAPVAGNGGFVSLLQLPAERTG